MNAVEEIVAEETYRQIIVPVFKEGEGILKLYQSLQAEEVPFDTLTFVYDFPEDPTVPYIEQLRENDSRISGEYQQYGRGVLNALRWGFSKARPGPVIVMMGDSSDKLSIVPEMYQLWEQGAVVVSPSRYMKGGKQHGGPLLKGLMSKTAGLSLNLFGFPTADPTNNFKLYDGDWLKAQTIESRGGFELAIELCHKAHAQRKEIKELPTEWFDRTEGESNFKLWSWLPEYLRWYFKILGTLIRGR